MRKIKILESN
ncbi:hypothetical protein CGLO_15189 [Colletotrichum gloeosporioides Cg-14]|uniref:Uncharacterized protein n=1 Tax=Colletotrichum gloeosporioides (strain Cg-14) TaxID=1237896 RepID=T0JRH5_COLGC|nr:hypothetical protein CGLO_15189 [Colletotrichum gloeosporioides Cg-14]